MDTTNEKRNGGDALVVLLRAEERAERAADPWSQLRDYPTKYHPIRPRVRSD